MRWALKLSAYRYVVEHLAGERNVWADMLTRWAVAPHSEVQANKIVVKSLLLALINPELKDATDAPSEEDLRAAQAKTKCKPPAKCRQVDGLWKIGNAVWIPGDDKEMKTRILIAAHAGPGGHRGQKVTAAVVQSKFQWSGVRDDVQFFKNCTRSSWRRAYTANAQNRRRRCQGHWATLYMQTRPTNSCTSIFCT